MRLNEISEAITALGITEPWGFAGEDFLATLEHIDTRDGPIHPPYRGDLDLRDPFLLVDHAAHVPSCGVNGFRILQDLEQAILGGAGLMNFFTTHCVAFIAGRAAPFRLFFRDKSGAEVVFDKTRQIDDRRYPKSYPDRRIEWL